MKNNNSSNKLIKLFLLLTTGFMAVSPLDIPVLNYVFRIPSLLLICFIVLKYYPRAKQKYVLPLTGIVFTILINFTYANSLINFDLFLAIVSVLSFLFLIIISPLIKVDDRMLSFIYKNSLCCAVILIVYAVSPLSHWDGIRNNMYMTFGYENSNYAGIVAFLVSSLLMVSVNTEIKKQLIVSWFFEFVLLYLIYETGSRGALVAAVVVPLYMVFLRNYKLNRLFLYVLCSIPFFFVPFYMNLFKSNVYSSMDFMGKSVMSGRQWVYESYLSRLHDDTQVWFGNLCENGFQNAHNGPLAIYVSVGIIGMIAFFYILINRIRLSNQFARSFNARLAVIVILATFLNTCGEASLFLGGFPGITFLFFFFVISSSSYVRN
jgi:hypothetical protein